LAKFSKMTSKPSFFVASFNFSRYESSVWLNTLKQMKKKFHAEMVKHFNQINLICSTLFHKV
jgi:hypothetical protein